MSIFRNLWTCNCILPDRPNSPPRDRSKTRERSRRTIINDKELFILTQDIINLKTEILSIRLKITHLDKDQSSFGIDLKRLEDKLDNKFETLSSKIDLILMNVNSRRAH